MTTTHKTNTISKEHIDMLSIEDLRKMAVDLLVFGACQYEITTDDSGKVLSIKYVEMYAVTA